MPKRLPIETQYTTITIGPGEIHCSAAPQVISTLLGSCVALCLHDPVRAVGGMNHIVLPDDKISRLKAQTDPRYGPAAVECLLELMTDVGARHSNLVAKVFGGGAVIPEIPEKTSVGDLNVQFVLNALAELKIPLEGFDVLGNAGKQVKMFTLTGDVWVRPITPASTPVMPGPKSR